MHVSSQAAQPPLKPVLTSELQGMRIVSAVMHDIDYTVSLPGDVPAEMTQGGGPGFYGQPCRGCFGVQAMDQRQAIEALVRQ